MLEPRRRWLAATDTVRDALAGLARRTLEAPGVRAAGADALAAAFAQALAAYHASPLVAVPEYPRELAELVEDRRGPRVQRHLRVVPLDPVTGRRDWVTIVEAGRIVGVHSASTRPPLRRAGFPPELAAFEKARTLADWRFVPVASSARPDAPAAPSPSRPNRESPSS
ncbi:MAG: hypothetical protein WCK28_14660 [Burkholderiales bacterium]